jgi:hypothetical protein
MTWNGERVQGLRPLLRSASPRRRSRHRFGPPARRVGLRHAGSSARQLESSAARTARRRDRQPARLRVYGHGRGHLSARAIFTRPKRTAHRRRHPDRCGAQPRKLGRAARCDDRRGRRHQHRDDQLGARHLLCGRKQHGCVRPQSDRSPRMRAPLTHRDRGADCAVGRRLALALGAGPWAVRISEWSLMDPRHRQACKKATCFCRSTASQ